MFDSAVPPYHDQGHITLKVLGFQYDKGIGKWQALNELSLVNAIECGVRPVVLPIIPRRG